ncbi:Bystin [Echinococcus multilocularis]|uniref:Bystin n=1 Tax=Echinococcus multilocularis TaxID=6211 RepID=A0A0S4MLR8_ECHMU|nr:Bystin [Echinococcus multilocularis]
MAIVDFKKLPDELKNYIRVPRDVLLRLRYDSLPKTIETLPHLPRFPFKTRKAGVLSEMKTEAMILVHLI